MSRNQIYRRFTLPVIFICFCFAQSAVSQTKTLKTDDGYLLELFTQIVLYSRAKTNCQNRGGWLVRIKDANMKQNLKKLTSGITYQDADGDYFIGMKYEASKWLWNDGTELTEAQANWDASEGNAPGQYFASFSRIDGKWSDIGGGEVRRYICQSDLLTISTDTRKLTVVEGQSITVKLKIASKETGKTEVKVYKLPDTTNALETISNETVALYEIGNINESDEGKYMFVARPDGESYNRTTTVNIIVHVYGAPTITNYMVEECSVDGKVSITWKPNTQTIGINHRVEAEQLNSPNNVISKNMISNPEQSTTFANLSSLANYRMKITVCPDECISKLNTTVFVTTGIKLPNAVSSATVHSHNATCIIDWIWSDTIPLANTTFEIDEASTLIHIPPPGQQNYNDTHLVKGETFKFEIATKPNRRYVFTMRAKTCAGKSEDTTVVGECVTESGAPDTVAPAKIVDENSNTKTKEIQISIPNETNGPVSCIFVIMKSGKSTTETSEFTQDKLHQAADAAKTDMSTEGIEYLAMAISRSTIDRTETNVKLGDETVTKCNTDYISRQRARSNRNSEFSAIYAAKNWLLTNGVTYTFYIVTSTPSDTNGLLFAESPSTTFEYTYGETATSTVISVSVFVISICLIIAAIVVFIWKRGTCKAKTKIETEDRAYESPVNEIELYERTEYEISAGETHAYQNVAEETHAYQNVIFESHEYSEITDPQYETVGL